MNVKNAYFYGTRLRECRFQCCAVKVPQFSPVLGCEDIAAKDVVRSLDLPTYIDLNIVKQMYFVFIGNLG